MALPAFAMPLIMGGLGAIGGKGRSNPQPSMQYTDMKSQTTPYDFMPGMEGNQGADLLSALLGGYSGLLGRGLGPSQNLGGMLGSMNQEFYDRRA